jgi:hypothetical protein
VTVSNVEMPNRVTDDPPRGGSNDDHTARLSTAPVTPLGLRGAGTAE